MTEVLRPLWATEHGDRAAVPPQIASDPELVDVSWKNDVCPSFMAASLATYSGEEWSDVRLWVDYENRDDREYPENARLAVCVPGRDEPVFESEDDVIGAIAALKDASARVLARRNKSWA